MQIFQINNNYTQNIYPCKHTGVTDNSQIVFQAKGKSMGKSGNISKDVFSAVKKFEELSPEEQRKSLFKTFDKKTNEDANAKIEGYDILKNAMDKHSSSSIIWEQEDLYEVLSVTNKDNLPLLKKLCERKETLDGVFYVLENTDKNNVKYKLRIYDIMQEKDSENETIDIVGCTDDKNFPLIEFLLNSEGFPWDYIHDVAKNIKAEDCKPKIDIYKLLDKYVFNGVSYEIWDLIKDIIRYTNSKNFNLAKVLVEDKNIKTITIPTILEDSPTKKQTDTRLYAYNTLKDRDDVKKNRDLFASSILHTDYGDAKILKILASNPKFSIDNISHILSKSILGNNISSKKKTLFLNEKEMSGDEIQDLIEHLRSNNIKLAEKVCFDPYFSTTDKISLLRCTSCTDDYYCDFLCESDLHKLFDNYKKIHQTVLNTPEMYINENENSSYPMTLAVDAFFNGNMAGIMGASYIFDLKTMNDLLRMRFDDAEKYLENFTTHIEYLKLLKKLCNSNGIDGKPLSSLQKIEMLDLINAYADNDMPFNKIEEMAERGTINIDELNLDLINTILEKMNINTSDIPKDKLLSWNLKYIHLLARTLENNDYESKKLFEIVINAANSERSFKDYIQDTTNKFGYNNKATMLDFKELKMNYDKWVNPDKKNNVQFVYKDENKEKLSQISDQIEEDINTLLHSMDEVAKSYNKNPVRKILYNSFGKYMVQEGYSETFDRFVIPANIRKSKTTLTKLVNELSNTSKGGQLTTVWNNAKNNLNNPQKQERAKKNLIILDHLEQRLEDLKNADRVKNQNIDLTIKMWDRKPQKDFFQGNYSTCCIKIGGISDWSIPVYLLNTVFNMIELVDNNTGGTVGNALCYFVKDLNQQPMLIIDNIEIKNSVKPSYETAIQLRTAITQYAKNITQDVTGKDDIPILLGQKFNDVPTEDLKKSHIFIKTLGEVLQNEVYTDAIDYTEVTVKGKSLYKLA